MSKKNAKREVLAVIRNVIREDERFHRAFAALRIRGASEKDAEEELARALLGCLWEASNGHPDRTTDVLQSIENGRSSLELFPDELYNGPRPGDPPAG